MAPAIPCSASTVALSPGTTSRSRKIYNLTRYDFLVTSKLQPLLERRFFLPVSISLRSSPKYGCAAQHGFGVHIVAAAGNDIAEEGPDSAIAGEDDEILEIPINAVETGKAPSLIADANTTHAKSKRQRPVRKSETPTVKNEELVPGATFTGKVISIQPFGAFVDIGAFTDGLVHVSQLGNNYVEDVGKVVFIGQEVKVRIVEANIKTGRIALTMRKVDDNDITKLQEQGDAPSASSDKLRPGRGSTSSPGQERDVVEKSSKFVKGQILQATIKNLTRVGAFVSLPESEEGFLPTAEESDEAFASMMGGSALKVGQEVSVRVLRISKGGQVTLTMKKDEAEGLNSKLVQGAVHPATNPFAMAFRKNKDVVTFWDETRKVQKPAGTSEKQKSSQEMERSQKPN